MSRRRSARKTELSSDVLRFRGLWQACALAAAGAALLVIASTDRDALLGAPGALSWPHARAGLSCTQCHGDARSVPGPNACVGCHGPRRHIRPGHAARARAGELICADCHREHTDHGGVVFRPDGAPLRYGLDAATEVGGITGAERAIAYRPAQRVAVAVIPADACARCHHIDNPGDPVAACVLREHRALGGRGPTTCFDEHRPLATTDPSSAFMRDPAWEAAREVLARAPIAPRAGSSGLQAPIWVALAVALGLLIWLFPRAVLAMRARRRARRERERAAVVAPPRERKLPTINTSTCIGCYACVDACPYDVLAIRNYVATVARPADCCGLTLCEQRCPNGSLRMGDGEPITDSPLADDNLQSSDVPGLYLAGDVTGLPLIRNAINQGAHAARSVIRDLASEKRRKTSGDDQRAIVRADRNGDGGREFDVVVIGAGPAGLSAALALRDAGLSYTVLEQQTVAASVNSFPRGKLVFDQPLELPLIGDLWLQESTKEELMGHWLRIVRRHDLQIQEHTRVTAVTARTEESRPESRRSRVNGFVVSAAVSTPGGAGRAEQEDLGTHQLEVRARRIVVAIGRRGSPRRLPIDIPEQMARRVFYSLADARAFAGQRVLVVGLGDVAMEAAIALARQPGTEVAVSYRGADFRRGKARTIETFKRCVQAGSIRALFGSQVLGLRDRCARLQSSDGPIEVPCDAVFVLIGAIPPTALLRDFGLQVAGDSRDPTR